MKNEHKNNTATPDRSDDYIMGVVKMNDKGQIIIPVDLRKKLNIGPGNQLIMSVTKDGKGIMIYDMRIFREIFLASTIFNPDLG